MLVGGVIHITELAAVAEGAGVLAAFGTAVEIMVHSFMGGSQSVNQSNNQSINIIINHSNSKPVS